MQSRQLYTFLVFFFAAECKLLDVFIGDVCPYDVRGIFLLTVPRNPLPEPIDLKFRLSIVSATMHVSK